MRGAIKDRDRMQGELATASAKLQIPEGAFTASFGHLKPDSNKVRAAEAAVQKRTKSNLWNYI